MAAYYNEWDSGAADWLENMIAEGVIPHGHVDRRSIAEVSPDDVRGYVQRHWFAGVGGWALALRIAGVADDFPIDTCSCPCQPFSAAGEQRAQEDDRHLWPQMFRIFKGTKPSRIIGEQVPNALNKGWIDASGQIDNGTETPGFDERLAGVRTCLEREDYEFGFTVFPACSVGSPQIRQRIYWCASLASASEPEFGGRHQPGREHGGTLHAANGGRAYELANNAGGSGSEHEREPRNGSRREASPHDASVGRGVVDGLASAGQQPPRIDRARSGIEAGDEPSERRGETIGKPGRRGQSDSMASADKLLVQRIPSTGQQSLNEHDDGADRVEHATSDGREQRGSESNGGSITGECRTGSMGESEHGGCSGRQSERRGTEATLPSNPWSDYRIVACTDGKSRRIGTGIQPLDYGVPLGSEPIIAELQRMGLDPKTIKRLKRAAVSLLAKARGNRCIRLRGAGNAIVPEQAAEFIRAFMDL